MLRDLHLVSPTGIDFRAEAAQREFPFNFKCIHLITTAINF